MLFPSTLVKLFFSFFLVFSAFFASNGLIWKSDLPNKVSEVNSFI